jgi:Flp pilus assembly protein TadD
VKGPANDVATPLLKPAELPTVPSRPSSGKMVVAADPATSELAAGLVVSGLVKSAELNAVLARFRHLTLTVEDLLAELARAGLLTHYQASALAQAQPADLCVGDYVVTDMMGESPRATVYRAVHRTKKTPVVIKVSSSQDTPVEDLRAAARLKHARLAPILEVAEQGDVVCQVMPYFKEGDLGRQCRKLGRLSVAEAVEHVKGAAEGMHFASKKGLVHGGLGTANLLLDDKGHSLVSDLGWAKVRRYKKPGGSMDLRSSSTAGLPEGNDLAAPELFDNDRVPDQTSDVYSLGATLFFLLTGIPPKWDKERGAVPELKDFVQDLPAGLQYVFSRMVAHNRAQRYATYKQVYWALNDPAAAEANDQKPVVDEEKPPEPKKVPFYKQPTGGAALTFLAVLAVVGGVLGIRTFLGAEFTVWDWGRVGIVAALAALVFRFKWILFTVSQQFPILVGALGGLLWAIVYTGLDLPAADLMGDLGRNAVKAISKSEANPAGCLILFGLFAGTFAGAMSYRGAVFMSSGAFMPVLAMAIFISGYEIKAPEDSAYEDDAEGQQYIKDAHYARAIAYYDKVIRGDPKRAGAYFHRGRAYQGLGDTEKARLDFGMAIQLRPKNPEGFAHRGDVYRSEKNYLRAYDDYRASLELDRSQRDVRIKRGEMLLEMDDLGAALADFNDALVANDRDPTLYLIRAKALEKLGRITEARADRELAQKLISEINKSDQSSP